MKILKKLGYILCFTLLIILLNFHESKAATDISNLTTGQLFEWLSSGSKEYFKMDPTELINKYSNYNNSDSMIKNTAQDDNYKLYWKCIQQYSNGSASKIAVVNVIDIYPDGKVKVYYHGGQFDVTNSTHLATFNSYANILANATPKSYNVESYYRYAKSQFETYNIYCPPNNSIKNTMSATQAATYNGKNAYGYSIRFLVIRMYQGKGQDRIIYGKTREDVFVPSTGSLKIIKQDQDGNRLAGAEFSVTASNGLTYAGRSNENGEAIINNIPVGNCSVKETKAPSDYNVSSTNPQSTTINGGQQSQVVFTNEIKKGSLTITKRDETTKNALSNVGFTLKMTSGKYEGKYVSVDTNGIASYSDRESTLKTNSKGILSITKLWPGNYQLVETVMPHAGYEANYSKSITVNPGGSPSLTVENKRKYINLAGYVWEDKILKNKQEKPNGLYKSGSNDNEDKELNNVTVQLKNKNGALIASKTTGKDGKYLFEKVEIDKLKEYYIEFIYNGMSYESVDIVSLTNAASTKAIEGDNRTTFNGKYAQIVKTQANDENGNKTYDLDYKVSDYQSKLKYGDESSYQYGYDEQEFPINGVEEQYKIIANTRNAYQSEGKTGYLTDIYTEAQIRENEITQIDNINLGLKERAQPDLALVKDLYRVKVSINNQTHIYNYGDRFNENLYAQEGNESIYNMNPQVKFGGKYGSMSYTRALYASDIKYTGSESLKVYATYRIAIRNNSDELKTVVNEIVDYTDVKYEFIKENGNIASIGRNIDEEGNIVGTKLEAREESSGNPEYQKIRIQTNLEMASQTEESIYIQLQVEPDKIVDILGNNNEEVKLNNIAEISSYSIKDTSGNVYAGIDIDSQPDNIELTNPKTYEDDTDKAPGLKLVLQEQRKVSGQVFEDVTNGDFKSGEIRQGDGRLTSEDKGIEGVTVKLVKVQTGETAQVYNGRTWVEATTQTNNNGEYTIEGFIPDNYKVVYTWGDSHYKVQDYKSTIVDRTSYNAKSSNEIWYKDEFKKNYPNIEWNQAENIEIRVSDAVDDYTIRQNIDKQNSMIINSNKAALNNYSGEIEKADGSKETLITKMDSTTPNFKVGIEYFETGSNAREEYQLNSNGEVTMNGIYAVKQKGKENYLTSIDFGIVERARQVLALEKQIKSAKIVLANGSILINAKVVKDEATGEVKFEDTIKHAAYIPDSTGANRQIKFEIDNEIIQGARLEIEYALQVSNISELEYLNQEYYFYGRGYGQNDADLVMLKSSNVIDYLDNNITINEEGNQLGEMIQDSTKKNQLIDKGLLENTTSMKNLLKETTKVMIIDQLAKDLKPIGTSNADTQTEISLKAYKLLANTTDTEEMIFDNNAEIIKVEKTGGSSLITTPGNYIPSLTPSEFDDHEAETVTIVPPMGLTTDYIAYTILAISSLGIFIAGIILIKKFVLRR